MSDIALADRAPSRPLRVTGKLRSALELMVDDGQPIHKAAQAVGISTRNLRQAFERPHVLQFVRHRRQMLLAGEAPRTIHRLIAIRDKADNMPAVNAAKMLLELEAGDGRIGGNGSQPTANPGVTIVIQSTGQVDLGHSVTIDGKSSHSPAIPDKSTT